MRLRLLGLAVVLAVLPACSLSRSVIGGHPADAGFDAPRVDAFRADADVGLPDAGMDMGLPDLGLPDTGVDADVPDTGMDAGTDAFVAPIDMGTDVGRDAFVPPVDVGTDGGPCALCATGQMCCSLACVDVTSDPSHCGSCNPCPAVMNATSSCASSACTVGACSTGFLDCNGTFSDGCETATGTTTDCLSCGDACMTLPNTMSSCAVSGCAYACATGYASCNAASPDCETHTDIDPANCGACGRACHTGQSCSAGACHGWGTVTTVGAPSGRSQHTSVWTGTVMIVWGGTNGAELNTGARYNPATDTWTAVSTTGAPGARRGHAAVWTGSRMIVWGGYRTGAGWLNDGGIYDPAADTWAPLPGTPPAARSRFGYAYDETDHDLLVFGGWDATSVRNDGSVFDGTAWSAVAGGMRPSARRYFPIVWSGSRFIVWGGENAMGGDIGGGVPTNVLQDGSRYDPTTDTWAAMNNGGRPAGRSHHVAVWTGTQMLVWGGWDASQVELASGGRYTLSTDVWSSMAAAPIGPRIGHTAVYTGTAMLTWGGTDVSGTVMTTSYLGDGGVYVPASDTWSTMSGAGAPLGRTDHTAVWTGTEMIVWGGENGIMALANGGIFAP